MCRVPEQRIRTDGKQIRRDGEYVLYWMTSARRTRYNFSLERAIEHSRALERPLLVFEPLRIGYRWASERFHRFIIEGMEDQARVFAAAGVQYFPYVERHEGEGSGLLEALAARACVVVTDLFPCSFFPRMTEAARARIEVPLETVDSNGLMPIAAVNCPYFTAHSLRRFLQRELPDHLLTLPLADPLSGLPEGPAADLPPEVNPRHPGVTSEEFRDPGPWLAELAIDHEVRAVSLRGGERTGRVRLEGFLNEHFSRYASARNQPEDPVTSGLSPWLHFGHLSSAEVFARIADLEEWDPSRLAPRASGSRSGWWGMSEAAEGFLEQLITWRELGFNLCDRVRGYDRYDSLPEWARRTLEEHEADPRDPCYPLQVFENAETHDPLWNAAQEQLRREGFIHNYLRMLWGKKVLHWAKSPRLAFEILVELNNKYALDGRDPNSYSAIGWIFGRFDRAWGPERPIFGKVRYMSSENTARKIRVRGYIQNYTA